jgi:pimeloyl-ACP methyl ester carboxylesterase
MKILAIFLLAGSCLATNVYGQEKKEGFFRSFDSTRIYYEVKGCGFPVLLIHGFMNNGDDWKKIPLYEQLTANGYMVITIDQRGNGKSDKPHNAEAYANDAEAKDLIGLMNFLGINKYAFVGTSVYSLMYSSLFTDHLSKKTPYTALKKASSFSSSSLPFVRTPLQRSSP